MPSGYSGTLLIAPRSSDVSARCHGYADRDARRNWTSATRTQIGSISKQFVAVTALLLADRGVVDLDAAVAAHLPGSLGQWREVSLRHLLTNTSGMVHWSNLPGLDPATPMDPTERLDRLLAAPLVDAPGRVWRYSSPGYVIAAAVLERAARSSYPQLVTDELIGPLGLTATTVGEPADDGAARGYRDGDPAPAWELHNMPGTGDVWSTAADVARFITAVHSPGLLPAHIHSTLHDIGTYREISSDGESAIVKSGYGLGHFVGTIRGQQAYLHPGDNPGYLALAAWLPARETAIVALSNDETNDIAQAVADLVTSIA